MSDLFEFDKGSSLTPGERAMEEMLSRTHDPAADLARERAEKALMAGDPERTGKFSERSRKGKASKDLGNRLTHKVIEFYQGQGFMACRVDYGAIVYGGGVRSLDLLGVGDVLAIGHRRTILVQCTVEAKRTEHERKLCADEHKDRIPRILRTPYDLALDWLAHGGEIQMVAYEKDERGHWQPSVFDVTREWLIARHDKLKARRAA